MILHLNDWMMDRQNLKSFAACEINTLVPIYLSYIVYCLFLFPEFQQYCLTAIVSLIVILTETSKSSQDQEGVTKEHLQTVLQYQESLGQYSSYLSDFEADLQQIKSYQQRLSEYSDSLLKYKQEVLKFEADTAAAKAKATPTPTPAPSVNH